MKYLLGCLLLFTPLHALCQSPNIIWQHNLGSFIHEGLETLVTDSYGNLLLSGTTFSNSNKYDAWIVKTDAGGNIIWSKTYGGSNDEGLKKIKVLASGSYIVVGGSKSSNGNLTANKGDYDIWIMKLDSNGNLLWQKNYGGTKFDYGYDIVSADDGFIITGYTASNDGDISNFKGIYDVCLLRIDRLGNIVWQKTLGGSLADYSYIINKTTDNNFILLAACRSIDGDIINNKGEFDVWLLKINDSGNILWQRTYGGSNFDWPTDVKQTADGGYIVSAYSNSNDKDITSNYGDYDAWIIKTDDTGKLIWQKNYGGSKLDNAFSIVESKEGGYLLAGSSESNDGDVSDSHNGSFGDVLTMKIDDVGTTVWSHLFGGSDGERANCIIQTTDSNYVFIGPTNSSNGDVSQYYGDTDPWMVKFNTKQSTDITTANVHYAVSVYPNPAKDFIVFEYQSPNSEDVIINISNIKGEIIDSIKLSSNYTKKLWDTRFINTGVYLYSAVNSKGIINTGRIVISK